MSDTPRTDESASGKPIPRDQPWHLYPNGTKAPAVGGGHWVREKGGWRWHNGDLFPTPGGDNMDQVILPDPAPSATPRTDAVWQKHTGFSPKSGADAYELAGQLEHELADAIRERDEARNKLFAQFAQKHLTCGWCMEIMPPPPGFEPPMTVEKHKATVLSHLMECPKYPARETERELAEARAQRDRLVKAGKALVDRWETPFWKDVPATAKFIRSLSDAIAAVKAEPDKGQPS